MNAPQKTRKARVLVSISDFLRKEMNRPGVNTLRMAQEMDISRNQLYRIKNGEGVNVETAERVLKFFGKKLAVVDIAPRKTKKSAKKKAIKKRKK